jgi:hypothetical protein
MPSPMPDEDPVTNAVFPLSMDISLRDWMRPQLLSLHWRPSYERSGAGGSQTVWTVSD